MRVALLAGLAAASAQAQAQTIDWTRAVQPGPIARIEHGMVSCAGRVVIFGGHDLDFNRLDDLWEYDPAARTWINRTPSPRPASWPSRRAGHAMACDPIGQRIIVFGGWTDNGNYLNGTLLNDTWEWSTTARTWTNVTPGGTKPVPRRGSRMVYDAANARVVLFGGSDQSAYFPNPYPGGTQENKTWVWNLAARTWTALTTTVSSGGRPFPGRTYHSMVYNSATNRVWIYGGIGILPTDLAHPVDLTDVWELVGTVWTDRTPAAGTAPAGRGWAGAEFNAASGEMFVHSGWNSTSSIDYIDGSGFAETWAFNGSSWRQLTLTGDNGARLGRDSHAIVADPSSPQRLILYGGYVSDVVEINVGLATAQTGRVTAWIPEQDEHSIAYDRDRGRAIVLGGGSPETWELTPGTAAWEWKYVLGPNGRIGHAMAYDPARRKAVLFGGRRRFQGAICEDSGPAACTSADLLRDTWEWDGVANTWTLRTPATSPPARYDHAMVYDAARNRTILFGGRTLAGTPLNDTWEWDGSNWTSVATPAGLTARFDHAMAFDAARQVVVLYGGENGSGKLDDTWERASAPGSVWTQRAASSLPGPRAGAALASYGNPSGGLLIFGGVNGAGTPLNTVCTWDGTTWRALTLGGSAAPTARRNAGMIYDPAMRRVVIVGGRDANGISAEVWYGTVTAAVSPTPVQVTPPNASGGSVRLAAQFRATSAASMTQMFVLLNSSLTTTGGVFVSFLPASNTVQLLRTDGSYASGTLGAATVLTNDYVSIDLATATRSSTATDVTIELPMTFSGSFNGPRNIYALVAAGNATPAGWQQQGTFFVSAGNSTPAGVSVSPSSGQGSSRSFAAVYRDLNGVDDLQQIYFLINGSLSVAGAVHLYYVPVFNRLYVLDDSGQPIQPGAVVGSAGTLGNSRFSVDVSKVSIGKTATELTLTLPIAFTEAFTGPKQIFAFSVDAAGAHAPSYQQLGTFTVTRGLGRRVAGDFNGDGAADLALFRPGNGNWMLRYSAAFSSGVDLALGLSTDKPVPGDYDGDGRIDMAVWRPSNGIWYVIYSSTGVMVQLQWGVSTDIPIQEDYTGDGRTDLAVWRPSTGVWYIFDLSTGTYTSRQWGVSTDIPLTGDFDGDGKADVAAFRPSNGYWYVFHSSTQSYVVYQWGVSTDVPVPADYNGDGRADIAAYRPSNGYWYVFDLNNGTYATYQWGVTGDVPVPRDYDGDGRTDLAVWRPSSGQWLLYLLGTGTWQAVSQGANGDVPIR